MYLQRLTYVSQICPGVGPLEIRLILGAAQVINRRLDLGGVLGYTDRHFFQVIEGVQDHVAELLKAIRSDPHHHNLRVLCEHDISVRDYTGWSAAAITGLDLVDTIDALANGTGGHGECGCDVARLVQAEAPPFSVTSWG